MANDGSGKVKMDDITFCFPIIRQDMILDALESLHKHTTDYSYATIVVNMSTPNREFEDALYNLCDLVIRPHANLGFAQGANLGIRISPTPYICVCNDDVLFTHDGWLDGVFETFEKFSNAAAVNVQSPKEPGWGWGEPGYRYLVPKEYMVGDLKRLYDRDRELMAKVKEAKNDWEEFQKRTVREPEEGKRLLARLQSKRMQYTGTQEELEVRILELSYDTAYLEALTEERNWAVVDAFACWCTVFRADCLEEIGLFDERFFPGGGEDYCWQHRCYKAEYRALSSSRAWAWHWWGQSKDSPTGFKMALPHARRQWNKLSTKGFGKDGLYDPDCCVWGSDWSTRVGPEIYRAPL